MTSFKRDINVGQSCSKNYLRWGFGELTSLPLIWLGYLIWHNIPFHEVMHAQVVIDC